MNYPEENEYLEENGFVDLWLERYSHFDGFTWDPSLNRMIKVMLPFDDRRMRLDRILMKGSKQIEFDDIQIFAGPKNPKPQNPSNLSKFGNYLLIKMEKETTLDMDIGSDIDHYMRRTEIDSLTIATYNTLFGPDNCYAKWLIDPDTRFRYQILNLFQNYDILGLQECSQQFLEILNYSDLQNTYQISGYEKARANHHFPLILSKIPFRELLLRDRVIYALFEWRNTGFIVVCAHMNALGKNKHMRKIEMKKINENLKL